MKYVPPLNGDQSNPERPYVDANPAHGVEGSIPPAAAIEHPMREIMAVITAAGLSPDAEDLTQLTAAIQELAGAVTDAHAQRTDNPHGVSAAQAGAVPLEGEAALTGGYSMAPLDLGTVSLSTVQISLGSRNHQSLAVAHAGAVFANPLDIDTWPGGEVRLWVTMADGAAFAGYGSAVVEQLGSFADMVAGCVYLVHLVGQGDGQVLAYVEEVQS